MNLLRLSDYKDIIENPLYINSQKKRLLKDFIINYLIMQLLLFFSVNVFCLVTIPIILIRFFAQIDYVTAWKKSGYSTVSLFIVYLLKIILLLVISSLFRFYVISQIIPT